MLTEEKNGHTSLQYIKLACLEMRRNLIVRDARSCTAALSPCRASRSLGSGHAFLLAKAHEWMKVALLAFGTRGDVQPLVVLAIAAAKKPAWCNELVFVTHREHADFINPMIESFDPATALIQLVGVKSPAVMWEGLTSSAAAKARANRAQEDACVEACRGAGLIIYNMFALEGFHVSEKMGVPGAVCHPYLLTATPMPSSFPGRMRRAYPRLFRRLKRPLTSSLGPQPPPSGCRPIPWRGEARRGPQVGEATAPCVAITDLEERDQRSRPGEMMGGKTCEDSAWTHVEHWMWPLFTDRWGEFRERLGLQPCPLQDEEGEEDKQGRAILYGASCHEHVQRRKGTTEKVRAIDPARLPHVLYLFSPLVVDTSPFWPKRVHVCGHVYSPIASTMLANSRRKATGQESGNVRGVEACAREGNECLPQAIQDFLSAREDRPLCLGFGSMWGMCPPGNELALTLQAMLLGAKRAGIRCVVVLPTGNSVGLKASERMGSARIGEDPQEQLDAAVEFVLERFTTLTGRHDLVVHRGSVRHELLFPRCSAAIHHGGSGTTAAVLRAGIPHVICPQHLDQFFWAERIRYLAVGSVMERCFVREEIVRSSRATPSDALICGAATAISAALTPQVKLRAACLGVKIRNESGLENALAHLSSISPGTSAQPTSPDPGAPSAPLPPPDAASTSTSTSRGDFARHRHEESECSAVDRGKASSEHTDTEGLMLREMPNGLNIWCAAAAEEETFFIFGEIFQDRTYTRMGVRVEDDDVVWDVGANVGLASIFFELETDAPDALQLYAFEPLPTNRNALRRNLYSHSPTAKVLGYALGSKNQDGILATFYPRMPGNSTFKPHEKERLQRGLMGHAAPQVLNSVADRDQESDGRVDGSNSGRGSFFDDAKQVQCDMRTVSWAISNLAVDRIDLMKVDVEGAELDVMLGIDEQDWPKIRQVVAEVHPVGDRVKRVCKLLRDRGFDVSKQALKLDGTPIEDTCTDLDEVSACRETESLRSTGSRTVNDAFAPLDSDTSRSFCGGSPSSDHDGRGRRSSSAHGSVPVRDIGVLQGVVYMVYARRL